MRSSTVSTSGPFRSGRIEGYPAELAARASAAALGLRERGTGEPSLAIVLGSGLGNAASFLENPRTIFSRHIPGMPVTRTEGHAGVLHVGLLGGRPVAVLEGRNHLYEGEEAARDVAFPIFLFRALGVRSLILTCASGAVSPRVGEGDFLLVRDHLNFMPRNPLRELGARGFGRFVDMEGAYDAELSGALLAAAVSLGLPLKAGILAAVLGPSYETPAELAGLAGMGVDVVTMSTVPEAILARYAGLRVACVSAVTNDPRRPGTERLTHRGVLARASAMSECLGRLLGEAVRNYYFQH